MFSDLNDTIMNMIKTNEAKAYPSVNSPNDGGFNSEENMRWLTKAVTCKPFIVGQTDTDVNRSFGYVGEAGNGVYIYPGFFSIDGYLGKIAEQSDISFDNTDKETFAVNNTQALQRFIHDLTNQGTELAIETELSKLLYYKYNPAPSTSGAIAAEVQLELEDAYENHKCIGYVWNTYLGDYASEDSIRITTIPYHAVYHTFFHFAKIIEDTPTMTNYIDWIETVLLPNNKITNGEPFACVINSNMTIFYPLFIEDMPSWNSQTKEYTYTPTISFTDIYDLKYYYKQEICNSRSYPDTTSTLFDMDGTDQNNQNPLRQVGFDNYKKSTYPSNLYTFTDLYTINNDGIYVKDYTKTDTSYTTPATAFPQLDTIKHANSDTYVFEKRSLTQNDLLSIIPSSDSVIPHIHNNLSYYCISSISDEYKYTKNGHSVPIAFMTSEGNLCPDGFIYSASVSTTEPGLSESVAISTRYPVEGYLHFAKRYYLSHIKSPATEDPSDDEIDAVDMSEMCNNSSFVTFFNETFAEPISIYLHLSYCSLIDNVVRHTYDQTTDFTQIKSFGCGYKLYSEKELNPNISQDTDEFFVRQEYTGIDPSKSAPNNTFDVTISYHKDKTSDNQKFQKTVVINPSYEDGIVKYYTRPDLDTQKIVMTDDPINYMRYCHLSHSTTNPKSYSIQKFNMYAINSSGKLERLSGNITQTVPDSGTYNMSVIYVDDWLMPYRGNIGYIEPDQYMIPEKFLNAIITYHRLISMSTGGQISSMVNGLCLAWTQNTWETRFSYTMSVDKDNLGYLRNINIADPGYYYGFKFKYKFPNEVNNDELFISQTDIGVTLVTAYFDIETSTRKYDIISKDVKHKRESYIHFNKLYGDNDETFEDGVYNTMKSTIEDLQNRVSELESKVIVTIGKCGDNVTYIIYQNGDVTLSGSGSTYDYTYSSDKSPFYNNSMIRKVEVSDGITEIGNYLFTLCRNLETISLPDTITRIGDYAFSNTGITGLLTLPNYLETIGERAFAGVAITNLRAPLTLTNVGESCFRDCTELETVIYRGSRFSGSMFRDCTSLTFVDVYGISTQSGGVSSIGADCFKGCSMLGNRSGSDYGFGIYIRRHIDYWDSMALGTNWDGKEDSPESTPYFTKIHFYSSEEYLKWYPQDNEWRIASFIWGDLPTT
jgi:hypothetical protein